jgi:hypothetical protein
MTSIFAKIGTALGNDMGEGRYNNFLAEEKKSFEALKLFSQQKAVFNREDEAFLNKMPVYHDERLTYLNKKGKELKEPDKITKNNEKIKGVFENMIVTLNRINDINQALLNYLDGKLKAFEHLAMTVEDLKQSKQKVLEKIMKVQEQIRKVEKMKESFNYSGELPDKYSGEGGNAKRSRSRRLNKNKSKRRRRKGKRSRYTRFTPMNI